jgi:hypothetical protein
VVQFLRGLFYRLVIKANGPIILQLTTLSQYLRALPLKSQPKKSVSLICENASLDVALPKVFSILIVQL